MKISISKINICGRNTYYIVNSRKQINHLNFTKDSTAKQLDTQGKSHFFHDIENKLIAKAKPNKYTPGKNLLRWMGRAIQDYIFLQINSRKEYKSNLIYKNAGLFTINANAWCISINPFYEYRSLYITEHLNDLTMGNEYIEEITPDEKLSFVRRVCNDISKLAKKGYYSRDSHLGNTLIDSRNNIIWVDTHVYRLPFITSKRQEIVHGAFIRKLPYELRDYASTQLIIAMRNQANE